MFIQDITSINAGEFQCEQELVSSPAIENSHKSVMNGNGSAENGQNIVRHISYQHQSLRLSLSWLDLKVFYVRVTNCEIDDSTPEYLTLNHIPLNRHTLLEVNGVRTSIKSNGASSLLRRDRLDRKSGEVTFVCTDSIRVNGSVKFEVFDKDVLVLYGVLELCNSIGCTGGLENHGRRWSLNCGSDLVVGAGFFGGKHYMGPDSASARIEVYIAGCFASTPIILTKTMRLSLHNKRSRKGNLDSVPEYETAESQKDSPSRLALQVSDYPNYKSENENPNNLYTSTEYLEGEDGELSWFSAGVRVGVGIGLSVCLGIGIGVGLLVRTYQGTTRTFRRRLL